MQISAISNTNFGKIFMEDIQIDRGTRLKHSDIVKMHTLVDALNDRVAKNISAYLSIGSPDVMGNVISARITTQPTVRDMEAIKLVKPDADRHDYKRRSLWVPLDDSDIVAKLAKFMHKQKGYIHYCKNNPNHRAEPFDEPKWKTSSLPDEAFPNRRKYVVKKIKFDA